MIRLEDGTELTFTPEVCSESAHVGESAWVDVDRDGARVLALTTIDPAVRARVAAEPARIGLLEQTRALGLAADLDEDAISAITDEIEVDQDDPRAVVHVLDAYYGERADLALRDGWVSADWREPIADFVAKLAAAVGGVPLLAITSIVVRETTERGHHEHRSRVRFATRIGPIERDVEFFKDLIALANEHLAASNDPRRFIDVTEDDQVIAVLVSPRTAKTLARFVT